MNDDELDRLVRDLPREADVPQDVQRGMWSEINGRIEPARSWRRGLGLAAAAVLLTGGVAFAMQPAPSTLAASTGLAALQGRAAPTGTRGGLLPAEDDLQAAVGDLERAYQMRRADLDPALISIFDENLEVVGDAVARSRAALAAQPGDPHLQRMLRHAYDQQLALLTRATEPRP